MYNGLRTLLFLRRRSRRRGFLLQPVSVVLTKCLNLINCSNTFILIPHTSFAPERVKRPRVVPLNSSGYVKRGFLFGPSGQAGHLVVMHRYCPHCLATLFHEVIVLCLCLVCLPMLTLLSRDGFHGMFCLCFDTIIGHNHCCRHCRHLVHQGHHTRSSEEQSEPSASALVAARSSIKWDRRW